MDQEQKILRIIAFGAHPDDCEIMLGGTATQWAALGHQVKFVATTNGDAGHFSTGGVDLALRRKAEVNQCAKILGIETQVLDIHDGQLMPDLATRRIIVSLIREWKADIVVTHRPYDYHPDHRNTGTLIQDAAVLVAAPFFLPEVPAVSRNPLIFFCYDPFTRPLPFKPDVVMSFDSVQQKKWDCIGAMPSQFADRDSWLGRYLPGVPEDEADRKIFILDHFKNEFRTIAEKYRGELQNKYGKDGKMVEYAEAFELCEYGRQPESDELTEIFPGS